MRFWIQSKKELREAPKYNRFVEIIIQRVYVPLKNRCFDFLSVFEFFCFFFGNYIAESEIKGFVEATGWKRPP